MRKILVAICLVFVILSSSVQKNVSDSLRRLIEAETVDTTRMKLMYQLANSYTYTNTDSAQIIACI